MNRLECRLSANGSKRCREGKGERKRKKKHRDDDDDDKDDETYQSSQDYNDDSQVDPEFRPTRRELREADEEGDS